MRSVHGRGRDRYADLLLRPRARRLLERRQQPAVRLPAGDAPCRGRQHRHAARRRAPVVGRVHLHGDREPDRRRARPQPRLQGVRLQRASRLGGRAGAGRPAARRRRDGAAKVLLLRLHLDQPGLQAAQPRLRAGGARGRPHRPVRGLRRPRRVRSRLPRHVRPRLLLHALARAAARVAAPQPRLLQAGAAHRPPRRDARP
mmetsp:Transcript_26826/g.80083  ORF Transcript_26826/g.80083 Transcript_26826/m.80083 type:complete len:201 (-) Transcript_26826:7-609(-)